MLITLQAVVLGQNTNIIEIKCVAIDESYNFQMERVSDSLSLSKFFNIRNNYPLFIINQTNYSKVVKVHELITSQHLQIEEANKNMELYRKLVAEHDSLLNFQEKRVGLYKSSYTQLLEINSQLSQQFETLYETANKNAKRTKFNGVVYGILSGLVAGITLGVVIN